MTKTKWLHFGLIGCALGGFAALAACSSNDVVDPGTTDSGTTADTGTVEEDSGSTTDAGVDASKPVFPKVALMHGSTAFGPIKLCLAGKQTGAPDIKTELLPTDILPKSVPAVPVGAYAVLPFKSIDPSSYYLTAIAIKPQAIARITAMKGGVTPNCGDFMKDAVLEPTASGTDNTGAVPVENKDFYVLATITPGTFKAGKSYVGIATGCPKGLDASGAVKCGPGYDTDKGNARVVAFEYDTSTKAGANNGVQFIHGSQEADPVLGLGGAVDPSVLPFVTVSPVADDAGAGRVNLGAATGVKFATSVVASTVTPTPALVTTGPLTFGSKFGIGSVASGQDITNQSVAVWAGAATGGTPPADYFKAGENYAFIAVGDPSQPQTVAGADGGATFNYNSFRIVAVPTGAGMIVPDLSNF